MIDMKLKLFAGLILTFLSGAFLCKGQTSILLYPDSIPNSIDGPDYEESVVRESGKLIVSNVTRPTLTPYLADESKATGESVIICPGGGYFVLAASHEGSDVARALNEKGIHAFVLKYRLPRDSTMRDKRIGPLQDVLRAIQLVRESADKWKLDPDRVGVLGFSAGGHLASTAGTHYERDVIPNPQNINLRPDFLVLIYPVISSDTTIRHTGSFENLLGEDPSEEDLLLYSTEKQITSETPPAYLVHAEDDGVKIGNSRVFADALEKNHVPVAMTIYPSGGHGFGLTNPDTGQSWLDDVVRWIHSLQ